MVKWINLLEISSISWVHDELSFSRAILVLWVVFSFFVIKLLYSALSEYKFYSSKYLSFSFSPQSVFYFYCGRSSLISSDSSWWVPLCQYHSPLLSTWSPGAAISHAFTPFLFVLLFLRLILQHWLLVTAGTYLLSSFFVPLMVSDARMEQQIVFAFLVFNV